MTAIEYLRVCTKDKDVLIQIWVPVKKEGRQVLTTDEQPFTVGLSSRGLESYRRVSRAYHFPADGSKEFVGLPGRVFLGKLPEWTPDVRFFRSEEYPRIDHAKLCDVRGSMAVPVFEQGSGTCMGVVEMVTTSSKINYRLDLDIVCKALEAVDLRSSQSFSTPIVEVGSNELCSSDIFLQFFEVLKSICKLYGLPLALTWAPCVKQGKEGCRHSDENYTFCVSTLDPACFVADSGMVEFLEACSEHHLLKGEGIVGEAFSSNRPTYTADITAFGKTEYPLSHHARIFDLHCVVAIPLTSIYSNSPDFVLEFFLPKDCKESEERSQVLNSLLGVIHQAFRNSQFLTGKELEEVVAGLPSDKTSQKEENNRSPMSPLRERANEDSSWISNMIETQRKGKGVSLSLNLQREPQEEFQLMTQWENDAHAEIELNHGPVYHGFWQNPDLINSVRGGSDSPSLGGSNSGSSRRAGKKRRTKTERSISLEVLRQYFAGSLKDAAKSLGVCPTTLKRICRQHGINRWPSRKIKKVGHSLKKLQHVIDSVQGAEGAIQLDSFYASFPELSPNLSGGTGPAISPNKPSVPINPLLKNPIPTLTSNPQAPLSQEETRVLSSGATTTSRSPSSCSQTSTSTASCSTGAKHDPAMMNPSSVDVLTEEIEEVLKRAHSDAELHVSSREESKPKKLIARSQSHKLFGENIPIDETPLPPNLPRGGTNNILNPPESSLFRVKATYGEEKIRFTLQPSWGFLDLQREIGRRFGIDDFSMIHVKYLDDDREWVLLTCDADLEECIDVYRASSQSRMIRISLHQASKLDLNHSLGSSGQSQPHDRFL
ncbi:protein NLP2-like isoform X2 [Punica granatum]|nr:protein NLP2-like isoform X2 [Punica granatum]